MNNLQLKIILSMADKLTAPLRNAMKGSKELAAALGKTKDEVKQLEKAQKYMERFSNMRMQGGQLNKGVDDLNNKIADRVQKLKSLTETTKDLRAKIKATTLDMDQWKFQVKMAKTPEEFVQFSKSAEAAKNKLTALLRDYEQASAQTKKYGDETRKAKRELVDIAAKKKNLAEQLRLTKNLLRENGVNTRQLASEEARLASGVKTTSDRLEEQRKKMERLNEAQKRLNTAKASYQKTKELQGRLAGSGAGLVAGGAAVGATAVKPIIEFAKAENAATGLKVSMMGAGGVVRKEFGAVNELASRLGNRLPGTTSELQNMMSVLIQQGMTAKSILGGVGEATAYLAVQMKLPYDQAALFSAKLQDATGTAEKDMMSLMDVIQRTYYLGVDSDNMLQAYAKMSPALSVLRKRGLEASKALAPLVVMADQNGMDGGASGNAIRKVFQMSMDAYKVGKANAEDLIGTGINLNFSDGKGEFAGLDHLFSELAKMRKLTTEKRLAALKTIFGDDAETLQVLTIMIEKGKSGYEDVQKKMEAQADIQRRVNEQLGTLTNLWDAATGTFTNALVKFGESVSPEVKAITEWIGRLSERLGQWSDRNQGLSAGIMKTVAAVSALMIGMGGLSLAVAAILGPLALNKLIFSTLGIKVLPILWQALQYGGGVFMWLGRLAMANPIGLLVMALAGAAVLIWQNWDWIKGKFAEFFRWIDEKVKAVAKMAKEVYDALPAAFKTTIEVPKDFKPGAAMPWMQTATAGGPNFITQTKPVSLPRQSVSNTQINAPITVNAQQGQDAKAIAAEVQKQLDAAQRNAKKQSRTGLSDRD